jgi:uncharacterized membrane protein
MRGLRQFIGHITRTRTGVVGSVLTTVSALLFIALVVTELVGIAGGPYFGIVAFFMLPALFVIGLLLIAVGMWLDRHRKSDVVLSEEERAAALVRKLRVFVIATLANLVIIGLAAFKGVELMETTGFCGQTCHRVMHPEFTSYQRSPHARVRCVDCHIGAGADWFVKSKLSGSWQVISVALNLYPKPIPTPVSSLRPARETCEQCHWPTKFIGERLKVISHFKEDEANTELKTVMLVKVGGIRSAESRGIHWHVDPRHAVRYRSDAKREKMYEVQQFDDGKMTHSWRGPDADKPDAQSATTWRTMDCVDCHNRPAHTFRPAEDEIDQSMAEGRLDRTVPFLRREALKALKQEYASTAAASAGIQEALTGFYAKSYPAVAKEKVAAAATELARLYSANVFPDMKITWGTYPNQLGHVTDMGCLRCHNGDHKATDGKSKDIRSDCDTCHTLLADSEQDPEILKTLLP